MEFKCFTGWEQLPIDADMLFACAEQDSLFFSRRWFENLAANALDDDQHLLLACVVDGDSVLAMLPLRVHHDGSWHSLTSYYSSLYTLLLSNGFQQEVLNK